MQRSSRKKCGIAALQMQRSRVVQCKIPQHCKCSGAAVQSIIPQHYKCSGVVWFNAKYRIIANAAEQIKKIKLKPKMMKFILVMFCSFFLLSKSIYSQTPDWLWAKSAGGNNDDKGYAVATDTQGNVYAVGYFSSPTIVFGNTSLINAGGLDIFLVKYNTTGEVIWAKSAGGTLNDVGFAICVDPSGNVLITGYFNSPSLLFGTTNLINVDTILNAYDYDDVFVA